SSPPTLSFNRSRPHRFLHSFPTRRSSDLVRRGDRPVAAERNSGASVQDRAHRVLVLAALRVDSGQGEQGLCVIELGPQRFEDARSEEHTSELQSPYDLVCRLLLEKKKKKQ